MIDEGAGDLDSKAFHEALANRAISFSARAERDYLVISISTLKENAPEAMHLLQLALTHPRFDNEALNAGAHPDHPVAAAGPGRAASAWPARGFARDFFDGHAYAHPTNGEIGSISAITAERSAQFRPQPLGQERPEGGGGGRHHRAGPDQASGRDLPAGVRRQCAPSLPNVGRLGAPGVHVMPLPVPQPTAVFGLPGIMRDDPDFIPGYVANYILGGGGFSSRLMDEVRVKRGLTYGISTSLTAYNKAA